MYVHTYICTYVCKYLLVKVLLQAVLQHCIKGRGGLGLELKAHNGTHLQGEWRRGGGVRGVRERLRVRQEIRWRRMRASSAALSVGGVTEVHLESSLRD